MIKLVRIEPLSDNSLGLHFSDGSHGEWSAAAIVARDTVMTNPLEEAAFFRRAFIEAGALAWPNGLDLSAGSLREQLAREGQLKRTLAA